MLARPYTSVVTKAMVQKNSRKLALPDAVRSGAHPGKDSASPRDTHQSQQSPGAPPKPTESLAVPLRASA